MTASVLFFRRIAGTALFAAAFFQAAACIPQDDHADPGDAYSEIYAAIDYKFRACGQKPPFPIVLPEKPPKYGTHLCALSIIRTACPFNDYPLFCLELYTDLPGIGP